MINFHKVYCYLSILLINLLPIICFEKYGWVIYMLLQPIAIMISATLYKSAENVGYILKRVTKVVIVFYCSTYMMFMLLYVVHPAIAHGLK